MTDSPLALTWADWATKPETWNGTVEGHRLGTGISVMYYPTDEVGAGPGWVPTRMGGASASDPLDLAHGTQVWLGTSDDLEAQVSGGYWHHMKTRSPDQKPLPRDFRMR